MNAVPKIPEGCPSGGDAAQTLCRSCGLCCDGSLFWAVELEAGEAVPDGADALRLAHGTNERIEAGSLVTGASFYERLIRSAAGPSGP